MTAVGQRCHLLEKSKSTSVRSLGLTIGLRTTNKVSNIEWRKSTIWVRGERGIGQNERIQNMSQTEKKVGRIAYETGMRSKILYRPLPFHFE